MKERLERVKYILKNYDIKNDSVLPDVLKDIFKDTD